MTAVPPAPERNSGGEAARSLRRALSILGLIHDSGQAQRVADVVTSLGIPKSTAYELMRVMAAEGLVAPTEDGRFALGRRLHELGTGYSVQVDLLREGTRIVRELRDETGETVQLSIMDGTLMQVLLKEEGNRAVRIISNVGSRVPVNWAAAGRLLVSDLQDAPLARLLADTARPSPTGRAETDPVRLIAQIRRFRAQGYAVEIGETNDQAGCVSAPVFDALGAVVAALSVVAPEQRLHSADFTVLVAAALQKSSELTRALTGQRA